MDAQHAEWWESSGRLGPEYPLVVSYHTGGFYARDAHELARTCQLQGLAYSIRRAPDLGTWERNTNYKPTHLLGLHAEHPDRPILWVDADARIWELPDLLRDLRTPVAAHTFQGREVLSGTVYLDGERHGGLRARFLQAWIAQCAENPDLNDQLCMVRALRALGIRHYELPASYCRIYDDLKSTIPQLGIPPVIEHYQASRWTRRQNPRPAKKAAR